MILGIDASRFGAANGTGIEAYSNAIIRHLLQKIGETSHCPFDRVHLYTPRPLPKDLLSDNKFPFAEERVITLPRLWTQIRLSAEMIHEPPDVLFIPSHVLSIVHPGKSVVTIHDVAFMRFPHAYGFAQRSYLKFSTWLAVREAAKLIVPSQAVADDLVKYFSCPREKIEVVHHGFEVSSGLSSGGISTGPISAERSGELLESFGLKPQTPYILYVGRLEEKKNLVRLIQAFLTFHETHPTWKLLLAGNRGFGFDRIFRAVEEREAWNHVVMPGYVTDEEREVLYKHCRFTAFVSLAEGFGFPLLESMAHGKDVLMSDLPVMHEIAGKAAGNIYANPLNVDAIAHGIAVLADRAVNSEHKAALKDIISKYTWDRAAERTLKVLGELAR